MMGRLTVPRQVSKNYKRTFLEHPYKLAMAKHDITIRHYGQHNSPYTCVCAYIHLCVILVFIYLILTHHFIVFLWFTSPAPFHALLFILQSPFYLSILFLCVLPPTHHWPNQNSALIHPLVLPMCLVCTLLIYQP